MSPSVTFQRKRFHRQEEAKPRATVLPIFEPSGLLELDSNNENGIQLQHIEPSDAISPNTFFDRNRVPIRKRTFFQAIMYDELQPDYREEFNLLEQSSYLIGRSLGELRDDKDGEKETVLADIPVKEETCSKQHCAIQFRDREGELKAYVIDLNSSNGTLLNGVALPRARYVELRNEDVLRFSTDESESRFSLVFVAG